MYYRGSGQEGREDHRINDFFQYDEDQRRREIEQLLPPEPQPPPPPPLIPLPGESVLRHY